MLINQTNLAASTLNKHEDWLSRMQHKANDLDFKKLNLKEYEKQMQKVEVSLEIQREVSENHENHFAMVENFVEKFIPIRIQS
mmetsp:Transcript_10896/g.16541  ORF Transcript_10896/g.16541 Transcript_10896/m.16541 type:complete len:83 (-) Transcript_10896:387-635(-)